MVKIGNHNLFQGAFLLHCSHLHVIFQSESNLFKLVLRMHYYCKNGFILFIPTKVKASSTIHASHLETFLGYDFFYWDTLKISLTFRKS